MPQRMKRTSDPPEVSKQQPRNDHAPQLAVEVNWATNESSMNKVLLVILAFILGCVATLGATKLIRLREQTHQLIALREILESSARWEWLSRDCLSLMGSGERTFSPGNGWGRGAVPASLLLLKPARIYADDEEVFIIFNYDTMASFSMKCRKDGSLWLYGDVAHKGPACIYPK